MAVAPTTIPVHRRFLLSQDPGHAVPLSPSPAISTLVGSGQAATQADLAVCLAGLVATVGGARRAQKRRRFRTRGIAYRTAAGDWPSGYMSSDKVEEVLQKVKWPGSWPYSRDDFDRQDESEDVGFYSQPRLCTHVDDSFIAALRSHYASVFGLYPQARILDVCSSWISHYPEERMWSHVSVTGMNEDELRRNKQADDYTVRDLNATPELPYEDEEFDIVTCTVSFDYLNKPLEVMREVARVLKPGGLVVLSTSNRCFQSKAVSIWLRTNDLEHVLIYGSYMHYTGHFEPPESLDLGSKDGIWRLVRGAVPAVGAIAACLAVDAAGGCGVPAFATGVMAAGGALVLAPPLDPVHVIQARKKATCSAVKAQRLGTSEEDSVPSRSEQRERALTLWRSLKPALQEEFAESSTILPDALNRFLRSDPRGRALLELYEPGTAAYEEFVEEEITPYLRTLTKQNIGPLLTLGVTVAVGDLVLNFLSKSELGSDVLSMLQRSVVME